MIRATLLAALAAASCSAIAQPFQSLIKRDGLYQPGRFSYTYVEAGYLTGKEKETLGASSIDLDSTANDFVFSAALTTHVFLRGRYTSTEYEVLEENTAADETIEYEASSSFGDLMVGARYPLIDAWLHLDIYAMGGFFRESFERDATAWVTIPSLPFAGPYTLPDRNYRRSGMIYEVGARTDFGLSFLDAGASYYYMDTKDGSYYQSGPRFNIGINVWKGLQIGGQFVGRSDEILENTTDLSHAGGYIRYSF